MVRLQISIIETVLDRSRSATPSEGKDYISDQRYLVRIGVNEEEGQLPVLLMNPGEVTSNDTFSVSVVNIDPPQYIDTIGVE